MPETSGIWFPTRLPSSQQQKDFPCSIHIISKICCKDLKTKPAYFAHYNTKNEFMFCKWHIDCGEEQRQGNRFSSRQVQWDRKKSCRKMLQDVSVIVLLGILNLIIWRMKIHAIVHKWIAFYALENTLNSCYKVSSTVTFTKISVSS